MPVAEGGSDIVVMPGEFFVGRRGVARTLLGSCVSLVFWHPGQMLGALNHFMLPSRERAAGTARDGRYADESLAMLGELMARHHAPLNECRAWLLGGAATLLPGEATTNLPDIGARNIAAGQAALLHSGAQLVDTALGGERPLVLRFDLSCGQLQWRTAGVAE